MSDPSSKITSTIMVQDRQYINQRDHLNNNCWLKTTYKQLWSAIN